MLIDKKNNHVNYNDEKHVYWNDNGEKYISVTTLIGKYEQEFDKEFWSKYKALQALTDEKDFKVFKSQLLKIKKFEDGILDTLNIDKKLFTGKQQDILDEWQAENLKSCERGTKIHAQMENQFYTGKESYSLKQYGLGGKFKCDKGRTSLDLEQGVYPEYLVYRDSEDGIIHLAGQIDLLVKDGNDISIIDYKTNKKLDLKSYYNPLTKKYESMKYPLNNIMDCNFYHYTLQLSTYAWMVQKMNPDFNIKMLKLIYFDHNGNTSFHELEYLKDDVERMLGHYRKVHIQEERKRKRQKIEF